MTRPVDEQPGRDNQPARFVVRGQVRQGDGRPLAGAVVRAFDQDLPSIQRREQRGDEPLGEAVTDERGNYTIAYTTERFRRAEKGSADLIVRVFDRGDGDGARPLVESRTLFNAPADATLPPLVVDGRQPTRPAQPEYEQLMATLAPALRGVSPAELTEEDISFLVGETGIERRRIEMLREADQRHRETREAGVPTVVFYAFARQGLPLALPQLLAIEPAVLRRALEQAIAANIVPTRLRESLDMILRQLDQVRDSYLFPATYALTGRLIDQDTATPLAGFSVRAVDLEASPQFATVRLVSSDDDGLFTLVHTVPRPLEATNGTTRHLRLTIRDRQDAQVDEQELRVDPSQPEPFVVRVAVPQAPSPTVAELTSVLHREMPSELSAFLEARGLHTLMDIRRAGGLRHLDGLPVDANHPAVLALEAHADLNRISPDLRVNADLNARGYNSVAEIARAPRRDIVMALRERVGDYKAAELHVMAQAQDAYLQNVLTDMRVELANGRLIGPARRRIERERLDMPVAPTHELFAEATGSEALANAVEPSCDCDDCETAVSPLAYLADLLNYAVNYLTLKEEKISFKYLTDTFHQPFGDLPATCDAMDMQVRQVRICCEVLRSELDTPLDDTEQQRYVENAYHMLLTQIGTASAEIRLARTADEQTRVSLGDRLGIDLRSEDVWKRRLDDLATRTSGPQSTPSQGLTEQVLEELFGLVDTQRDPLSTGVKHGDDGQQITRWIFYGDPWNSTADAGVRWNSNTDRNGLIYVRLRHDGAYHVELYRDAGHTQLVASGKIPNPNGTVELTEENESGLSGRFEIAYTADTDAITIAALPKLLSWRLDQLRTIWRDQGRPPDVYGPEALTPITTEELLPIVDPDLIGPDDLRHPYPGSLAFELWWNRRTWVDAILDELLTLLKAKLDLANSSPPPDALFALFERMTLPTAVTQLIAWDPSNPDTAPWLPQAFDPTTGTPDPFDTLHDDVTQNTDKERAKKATDIIQKQLHLTVDSFNRLTTIRDTYYAFLRTPKSQPVTDDEWREVASILVQAQKVVSFPSWRQEELEREEILQGLQPAEPYALFGPQEFWIALRDPIEETATALWPPADRWPMPDDEPLGPRIDPEVIGQEALPDQPVGQWARVLWAERREQLDQITKDLKARHEQPDGFQAMLVQALADLDNSLVPDENDPWLIETKLYELLQKLNGTNETERLVAEQDIQAQFHLSADNFKRLMAIREKTKTPGLTPTLSEWGEVDSILTSAEKEKRLFPEWLEEERPAGWLPEQPSSEHLSNYWQVLKARLPRWRASVEARLAWQQALRTRMAAPIVDPDVITFEDLKKPASVNPAHDLWQERLTWIEDQTNEVTDLPISLASFDAALLATLFSDAAQARFKADLVEVRQVSEWDSALKFVWGSPLPALATALADRHSPDKQKQEAATQTIDAAFADLAGTDTEKKADTTRVIAESLLLTPDEFITIAQIPTDLDAATAPDETNLLTRIGLLRRAIGLYWNRSTGMDIAVQLDQLGLPFDAFATLVGMRRLLLAGETVSADEWGDVAAILVQVRKRRAAAAWRERERQEGVTLGPDYFRIPEPPEISFPPPQPREYPAWRATRRDFQDWQDTLQMRIDQQQTVIDSVHEAVSATEEATLPQLRDALVSALSTLSASLDVQAKWVTDHLLIDASESGCQITTRISQAIETIQGLLWSVRTGLLSDTYPDLQLRRAEFDQEWQWIGSYATWRAAMFVFLYPENIIIPSLRRPEQQTPVFREIADELRGNRQLTTERVCEAAKKYAQYLEDVGTLQVEATCTAETLIIKGETSCLNQQATHYGPLFYMFGRTTSSKQETDSVATSKQETGSVYWSAYDPLEENQDYAQSFWRALPEVGSNVLKIIGAVPYTTTTTGRSYICLFVQILKQGLRRLACIKYDRETHLWDSEPSELELPSKTGKTIDIDQNGGSQSQGKQAPRFTAVIKQAMISTIPPHVAVRLESGAIYDRKLNDDATDWTDEEWHELVNGDEGAQFQTLHAMIAVMNRYWSETADSFYVFVLDTNNHLRYRFFDPDNTVPPPSNKQTVQISSAPGACSRSGGQTDIFIHGSDGYVWHTSSGGSDSWATWEPLNRDNPQSTNMNNTSSPAPTAVTWPIAQKKDRIDVLIIVTNQNGLNEIQHTWIDGTHPTGSGWTALKPLPQGTIAPVSPAACSWGDDHLHLFAFATDGVLWHSSLEMEEWSPWTSMGEKYADHTTSAVTAVSRNYGIIDIFAILSEADTVILYQTSYTLEKKASGAWWPVKFIGKLQYPVLKEIWEFLDNEKTISTSQVQWYAQPQAFSSSSDHIDIFAGMLWFEWQQKIEGGWTWSDDLLEGALNNDEVKLASELPGVAVIPTSDGTDVYAVGANQPKALLYTHTQKANPKLKTKWHPLGNIISTVSGATALSSDWQDLGQGNWSGGLSWKDEASAFWQENNTTHHASLLAGIDVTQTSGIDVLNKLAVHTGEDIAQSALFAKIVAYQKGTEDGETYRSRFSRLTPQGIQQGITADQTARLVPKIDKPVKIPVHSSSEVLQLWHTDVNNTYDANKDSPQFTLTYLEEAFYFLPMHLALQLQASEQYIAALDLFRLVYDYTDPVEQRTLSLLEAGDQEATKLYNRNANWLLDPLNPHAIAETRPNTYTRFTLLSLIRCLLEYADAEFTLDTAESVPRARTLYLTALELLDSPELKRRVASCDDLKFRIDVGDPELLLLVDEVKRSVKAYRGLAERATAISVVESALGLDIPVADRLAVARERLRQHLPPKPSPKTMVALLDQSIPKQETAQRALVAQPTFTEGALAAATAAKHDFRRAISLISGASAERLELEPITLAWLAELPITDIQNGTLVHTNALSLGGTGPLVARSTSTLLSGAAPLQLLSMFVPFLLFAPSTAFCIPPNPVLKALRMRAEANLYKIRTCRNIAGMERQIEPYAAPTDAESGLPTIGAGGQLILPGTLRLRPTPYRYAVIIERAKQLVQLASQVETAMLSALEKRDVERYNLLKARQDVRTARAQVHLQALRVREANSGVDLANLQQQRAQILSATYQQWLAAGADRYEQAQIAAYEQAGRNRILAASLEVTTQIAQGKTIVAGSGTSAGAAAAASLLVTAAAQGQSFATISGIQAETEAKIIEAKASFELKQREWELQKNLANQDILITQQQVEIAETHVDIAEQEQTIAALQAEHTKDIVEFLGTKFTNVELYDWMSDVLERVYRFFLQQATAMAQLAANQLSFERQEAPPPFILADYWEAPTDGMSGDTSGKAPDRRGLTGSARLLQDIYQLDLYAFDTDKRKLQLTKTISLARLDPYAFQRFTQTGVLPFRTTLDMFDRDFPGHYLRLIKRVRTSVVALIPPSQGIRATLVSAGTSRVVIGGDIFQTVVVRRSPELVALASPVNATGLFELDPQSEMLLPFEGLGVDTSWEFRMPRAANQFDYHSIADVLITIEYTALNSFDYYQQVIQSMRPTISADRLFSFRNQFADPWYDLHNPDQTDSPMIVRFTTERADFPSNIDNLKIQQMLLAFVRAEGSSLEVPVEYLRFAEQGSAGKVGGAAASVDGIISTRRGNAGSWTAMIGKSPVGTWELALTDPQVRDWLETDAIEDILLIITYNGRTPEWPM